MRRSRPALLSTDPGAAARGTLDAAILYRPGEFRSKVVAIIK
jgi:hypothetical protein